MLRDYLIEKLSKVIDLSNSRILDIGCGSGRIAKLLGDQVKSYTGIDKDKEILKKAKSEFSKFEFKYGSAEKIPYKIRFDIVFFSMSWHIVKDFKLALEEVKRVLNKEGILVILEPSEETTNWSSPKLRKDNPEFDEIIYNDKLKCLKLAENYLKNQTIFKIVLEDYNKETKNKIWILKLFF
ncbi:MAG: class I SAM-dependent methyltransferase [Candidatus Nanoarchaeia archaeon]|nr:class I SAM-dependent methyltransferase [Candidatus Nanoarchaeia archaeon]